jgi:hypothetical protein
MTALTLIAPHVLERADAYAAHFAAGDPFRHVVIESFLRADFAERLLAQFPPFEHERALNEAGQVGGKATVEKIPALGGGYEVLDDAIRSAEFLALVSKLTRIPGLRYDPHYFGGGTHENRDGQDLDPHIDFNRHPIERWHRRLNLIVYLNHDWSSDWGGALELHSDPRAPDDRVVTIAPVFNRCVIFETTEWSWHGFSRIVLPPQHVARSRKSIALYFYTEDRPAEELADAHSTVYVDRPLPAWVREGHVLSEPEAHELATLYARRDHHNQRLYAEVTRLQKSLDAANAALSGGFVGKLKYFATRGLARLRR